MKSLFTLIFIGMISFLIISCESVADKILPEPDLSLLEDEVEIYRSYEDVDNITLEVMQSNGLGARVATCATSGSTSPTRWDHPHGQTVFRGQISCAEFTCGHLSSGSEKPLCCYKFDLFVFRNVKNKSTY